MARCPAGHESQASDYCDTCGLVIGGEASSGGSAAPLAATIAAAPPIAAPPGAAAVAPGGARCPVCQAERNGRFCEECGYDFDLAEAMPQVTMTPGVAPEAPSPEPQAPAPVAEREQGLDLEAELARAEAEAVGTPGSGSSAAFPGSGNGFGASGGGTSSPALPGFDPSEATVAEGTVAAPDALDPSNGSDPANEPDSANEPDPAPALAPDPAEQAASSVNAGIGALSALSGAGAGGLAQELALVVDADADYYGAQVERGDIIESEFPYPKYPHERRFSFTEGPVRIGRASASRGLIPEIDLTGPPLDPAVSHLHAQFLRHEEGWVVVDLGSANGTRLNDSEEPLEAETEIPVKQGDRIHLGVWTTITVQ
jgi:hypothetical protein